MNAEGQTAHLLTEHPGSMVPALPEVKSFQCGGKKEDVIPTFSIPVPRSSAKTKGVSLKFVFGHAYYAAAHAFKLQSGVRRLLATNSWEEF